MKKYLIFTLTILIFWSCKKPKEEPVLELISYNWGRYDNYLNREGRDTIIPFLNCHIYAQIYKNGDCKLSQNRGEYKNELYAKFKLDTIIINPALRIIQSIDKDTTMIRKTDIGCCIYDGPLIRLIGNNQKGEKHTIKFIHSNRSNLNLLNLYNSIESIASKQNSNEELIHSKEKRIKEIYDSEFDSLPKYIIKSDIKFTAP